MQTRRGSLVESVSSTGVGFLLSLAVWQFAIVPVWGLQTSFVSNVSITLVFTIVSILRGYLLRRFFNWLHNDKDEAMTHPEGLATAAPRTPARRGAKPALRQTGGAT